MALTDITIPAPIDEENYFAEMENKVIPELMKNGGDDYFTSFDGKKIHYRYFISNCPKATVVISHGFTEFGEKFDEMAYYFHISSFNVFVIDHRGHGYSHRHVENPSVSHINRFDDYVSDFHCFINKVVLPASEGLPLYLYAHSMGGAVGILYLQRHSNVFDRALLTAPMVYPQTAGVPSWLTKIMTKAFSLFGQSKKMVFVHKEYDPDPPFESSNATSKARFDYYISLRRGDEHYHNSAASYKWVSESLKIPKEMLKDSNCKKIKAKVLLLQAEKDKSVKTEMQDLFVRKVPGAEIFKIPDSKHEIFLSSNDALKIYLEKIFSFFN